jgi:2',3'-cyclic-nucleotide 2'-phosphodiesterase (5'-nucleotidase family)
MAGREDRTILVHAGDQVGASPPASALLQDEPAIQFFNLLGNDLGNLIADAQRAALGTDFAFMNSGGIRADLPAGEVTWGAL